MFKCNLGNLKKPKPKCTLSHRAIAHGHLGLKLQRKCFLFLIKKQHHHVKKHYAQKCTKARRNFPIMYLDCPHKIFQRTTMKRLREYWAPLCVQNLILHHKAKLQKEGIFFLIHLFVRDILLMKKLEIEETKTTWYIFNF